MRKLKKILLFTDGAYPFVMGGMQKHSYYLAKYLTLNGVEVVLTHFTNEEIADEKIHEAFTSFNHEKITFKRFNFPKSDKFPGHYLRANKQYSKTIFEHFKDDLKSFDAIYAQGFAGWAFIEQKNEHTPPIFTNFHGYEMFQNAPSFKLFLQHLMLSSAVKTIAQKSDAVFSFGGKISEILDKIGVAKKDILECPIGIEQSWLNKDKLQVSQVRTFVFIGRYERRKGVEELHQAIDKLPKNLNYLFHFIGPIPAEKRMKSDKVVYHGSIQNQEKIKDILHESDVLVCPSYSEGMPTVIMEAMASGLAILATNVGAVSQQVSPKNGVLLSELTINKLQNALLDFVNMPDEELLGKKSVSLQSVQDKFLWENVIRQKIKLIEQRLN